MWSVPILALKPVTALVNREKHIVTRLHVLRGVSAPREKFGMVGIHHAFDPLKPHFYTGT